ncbi:helix-turn-helix domain-containing protein [Sphingobacterium olei]|uniref:Helix-turn-helix domain-containing protein n=1 Tax=Sphingobacterium olei TaxID=2571155 RepID=A0A4U0NHK1_9SPHI|nr:helix-turn-helix domain-containing protein [Sphingobacterium olei]TJZ53701.1 helix-turn-helix domain-containing protein [Sphingobacterium olei]
MNDIPVYKISDFNSVLFPDAKQDNMEFEIKPDFQNVTDKAFGSYFRSDFFAILLVIKGETTVNINFKEYFVGRNTLILTAPKDILQFMGTDGTAVCSVVAFSAKYLKTTEHARQRLDIPNYFSSQFSPIWPLNAQDAKLIHKLLGELYKRNGKVKEHLFGKELLTIAFDVLLYEISELGNRYSQLSNVHLSRKEKVVMEFTHLVQKEFKLEREVKYYASKLNVSPRYLTEMVKEFLGISSREVIDYYVVQEAILLMRNHKLSIAQIANELNFSDQSFFGKFFKRHTSLPPKEYRKSLLSIAP